MDSKDKPVIRNIAREAGVSVATVSRVLNNYPYVTKETQEKVLEVMRQKKYTPNFYARGLNRRIDSGLIGLVLPEQSVAYNHSNFTDMVRGLEAGSREGGYGLVFGLPSVDRLQDPASFKQLGLLDGLVLVTTKISDPAIAALEKLQKPFVLANSVSWKIPCVDINHVAGARQAVEHLIAHGRTRIAHITSNDTSAVQDRLIGYKATLKKHGVALNDHSIAFAPSTEQGGHAALEKLLSSARPPDAVFAANDHMAVGAMEAARKAGIKVPDEIAIIGFDNIHAASLVAPRLTTVYQPLFQMGRTAMEVLVQAIAQKQRSASRTFLMPELIVRQSCGCP